MSKLLCDKQIYSNMMSRDVNFRVRDLSGVFRSAKPWLYIRRLFKEGDLVVPDVIEKESPILNLTTHNLLPISSPVFSAFGDKLCFVEVVRHPLFMIVQQTLNMERLINNPRDISILLNFEGRAVPYFGFNVMKNFHLLKPVEQAIHSIFYQTKVSEYFRSKNETLTSGRLIRVPFEHLVKTPDTFLSEIMRMLGTQQSSKTKKIMKRERVPRSNIVDGIPLAIYKRCGWEPPKEGFSEADEYKKRMDFVLENGASNESLEILDLLCKQYETEHTVLRENACAVPM